MTKLEAILANAPPDDIGIIAALLSIPNDGRYPVPELSPQKRKDRTLTALLRQLDRLAVRQPVLLVFEDVHWSDPTTLELLTLTIERVQRLPVLLLVTARPEFKSPWPDYAHVTSIALGRIAPDEGASLIEQITGGKALPSEVLQQILARTDGIPLFVEELTKSVVESGVLTDAGDRYTVAGQLPALAIPTSLNASLLARLDRLAPVREVAQIGAALGRQFSHALISAVASMPQPQLDDALAQLLHAELIFRRGHSSRCAIHLQARAGAGHGVRHLAAHPTATAAWPYRRHARTSISGNCGDGARAAGTALRGSRLDQEGRRLLPQSGPAGHRTRDHD